MCGGWIDGGGGVGCRGLITNVNIQSVFLNYKRLCGCTAMTLDALICLLTIKQP